MSAWGHKLTMRLQFATSAIPRNQTLPNAFMSARPTAAQCCALPDTKTRRGAGCDECVALRCVALR